MAEAVDLDVGDVARLARLDLSAEEKALFQTQLGSVLEYVAKLREVEVSTVEESATPAEDSNIFREDEARDWLTAEEALRNAPRAANDLFVVPKVVE